MTAISPSRRMTLVALALYILSMCLSPFGADPSRGLPSGFSAAILSVYGSVMFTAGLVLDPADAWADPKGVLACYAGAIANVGFILALILSFILQSRFHRVMILSGMSVFFGIFSLLLIVKEVGIGPGFFVWIAAPSVLFYAAIQQRQPPSWRGPFPVIPIAERPMKSEDSPPIE